MPAELELAALHDGTQDARIHAKRLVPFAGCSSPAVGRSSSLKEPEGVLGDAVYKQRAARRHVPSRYGAEAKA